jgi:hypothetical protein
MLRPGWSALRTTLPANLGDPALIAWIYRWDGHAVLHHGLHFYNANIFWPRPHTLAYSDNLLSTSPAFNALYALTGSWAVSLNLTVVALVVMCLASTYSLTMWLTRRVEVAVIAAIAFSFSGFVLGHWGAIQLYSLGFFPLAFLFLFRTLHERRPLVAALTGVIIAGLVLGSLYYGTVFSWCAAVAVAGYVVAHRFRPGPGFLRALLITGVVAGVLIVPSAIPYVRVHDELHFERSYAPAWGLKAVDFVSPAPGSYLYPGLARVADRRPEAFEHRFFTGFSVMLLAAAGVGALVRTRPRRRAAEPDSASDPQPLFLRLTLLAGFAALVPALGPTVLGHAGPFRLFHNYWPGFSGLRVTARLAVPALLSLAVLAGVGFGALTRHVGGRTRALGAIAVGAVMLLEFAAPLHRATLPTDGSTVAVYRALSHRPSGAVAEVPMVDPRVNAAQWAYVEAPRMLYSTLDFHPRVNGYSGYIPPGYYESVDALNTFPSPPALQRASELGVRYVVLHVGRRAGYATVGPQRATEMLAALPPSASARRYGNSFLVDLRGRT